MKPLFAHLHYYDPRVYQISILSTLLIYGLFFLDFDVNPWAIILIPSTAILTQYAYHRYLSLPIFDAKSPLISALSLCLLLRTNSITLLLLAPIITISSKFLFRWREKHLFNPTNFGLVTLLLLTEQIWVSPGQWGNGTLLALLFAGLGSWVIYQANRADITLAFLIFYAIILFGRASWLGDPLTIPLHQLQSGALLLFAFFMLSDPKTTPDSRAGRLLFALLVALGAAFVQFWLYRTNGLLWSLAFFSLLTPIIDRLLPNQPYQWPIHKEK